MIELRKYEARDEFAREAAHGIVIVQALEFSSFPDRVYNHKDVVAPRGTAMLSTSESWLGIGVVVIIGLVVVGFSTCVGKLIIRLFGTEYEAAKTSGRDNTTIQSEIHEAA